MKDPKLEQASKLLWEWIEDHDAELEREDWSRVFEAHTILSNVLTVDPEKELKKFYNDLSTWIYSIESRAERKMNQNGWMHLALNVGQVEWDTLNSIRVRAEEVIRELESDG